MDINRLFYKQDLIPAIINDYKTGKTLMLAYMNKESLQKTMETGMTWFYSRKRHRLWNKGETSGHTQKVVNISVDCDEDTLLIRVIPNGPACHTGHTSCFYTKLWTAKTKEEKE